VEAQTDPAGQNPESAAYREDAHLLVDKAGAPQSSIRLGLVGIERKEPRLLPGPGHEPDPGRDFQAPDAQPARNQGLDLWGCSMFEARRAPGPWTAGGEFVANRTADSVTEILKEISALRTDEVGDKELKDTKDEIVSRLPGALLPRPTR